MHKPITHDNLRAGQRVRAVYEGTVEETVTGRKVLRLDDGSQIPSGILQRTVNMMQEVPTWQIGDVVVIRFNGPGSTPYTYIRDARRWPGITTTLTDDDVTRYVEAGIATHLVRAGEPVAPKPAPVPVRPVGPRPGPVLRRPLPF